jgi:hypothetical protein
MSKPRASFLDLGADALQRCPPQFQVISLLTIFLSVLASTVYILYLALHAPVERVVILLTLGYAGWQMQHASSVHQPSESYHDPSITVIDQSEPALPAYTPKSMVSTISDDSDDSDGSDSTSPKSLPPSIDHVHVSSLSSTTSSASVSRSVFTPGLSSIESPRCSSPALQSALSSIPRQIVFTTLKRLSNITVPPGSTAKTRILQQFANGTIQMEVSCGNIDYRLQLSPSEVLQLYEQSVKRPP